MTNTSGTDPKGLPGWRLKLLHWLRNGTSLLGANWNSRHFNQELEQHAASMPVNKTDIVQLKQEWSRLLAAPSAYPVPRSEDRPLLNRLSSMVEAGNRNNVTRTAAYGEIYRKHPELHWAFLAHMVSRNGGWSMTDLQGELLPQLLDSGERKDMFLFLERANSLIFQDAYPQLLLYEESLRRGEPLFRLLPHLNISSFMRPVWELFWKNRSAPLLTICLIINEQNYIEGRIVQNGFYQKHVLHTPAFLTQSILQLNQVLLPYLPDAASGHRLAGLVLEDFTNLKERIEVGKALYAMLFGIPEILEGAVMFARQQPHTGSRADYNAQLFSDVKKTPPLSLYTERLDGCGLKQGAFPLYSPPLSSAWKDHRMEKVELYDWFRELKAAEPLSSVHAPDAVDMTAEACGGLHKIELAVLAAQAVGWDES